MAKALTRGGKPTIDQKSAGGRDDPQVKGSLGSNYDPKIPGAKEAAAKIAADLASSKHSYKEAEADKEQRAPSMGLLPRLVARLGFRLIKELDPGEEIVSMISSQNRVYVATSKGVYRESIRGDVLEPLLFEVEDLRMQPTEKPTEGKDKADAP